MQYLPVAYRDAYMSSLMVLVAVEAAQVAERSVCVYLHFVHMADATAGSPPLFHLPVGGSSFTGLCKAVLAQYLGSGAFLLAAFGKFHYNATACYDVFVGGQLHQDASPFGPDRAVGSTWIPW